jgi:hypothetical protein
VHCTDEKNTASTERRAALTLLASATAWLAGCATPAPSPAPSPAPAPARPTAPPPPVPARPAPVPPPPPAPAPSAAAAARAHAAPNMGPVVSLPPAPASRTMAEFQRMAAQRLVRANPQFTYMGKPPPMMWAIIIIETTLNADGSVRAINVTRPPANPAAAGTVEYALEAIRRAGPYGDVSKLPQPVRWSEIFLFNDKNQFKPRTLD